MAKLCPTLCNPMDYNLPGLSVHGILQARILEWVAISFSRGFSPPRDWTWVSCIAGRFFTIWATRETNTYRKYHIYFTLNPWMQRSLRWELISNDIYLSTGEWFFLVLSCFVNQMCIHVASTAAMLFLHCLLNKEGWLPFLLTKFLFSFLLSFLL